jgi:hypothetical protein
MIEQPEKNIDRNKAPGEWLAGWLAENSPAEHSSKV